MELIQPDADDFEGIFDHLTIDWFVDGPAHNNPSYPESERRVLVGNKDTVLFTYQFATPELAETFSIELCRYLWKQFKK